MPKSPTMSREELRKVAEGSTNVNFWYPHPYDGTIRGPFNRWFTCSEVADQYAHNVAGVAADTAFASAAMNNLVPLLDEIDAMEMKIAELQLELILMGRITE